MGGDRAGSAGPLHAVAEENVMQELITRFAGWRQAFAAFIGGDRRARLVIQFAVGGADVKSPRRELALHRLDEKL